MWHLGCVLLPSWADTSSPVLMGTPEIVRGCVTREGLRPSRAGGPKCPVSPFHSSPMCTLVSGLRPGPGVSNWLTLTSLPCPQLCPALPKRAPGKETRVDNRWHTCARDRVSEDHVGHAGWLACSPSSPFPMHREHLPFVVNVINRASTHPARAQEQRTVSGSWTTREAMEEVFPQLLLCVQPTPTRAACGLGRAGTTAQVPPRCYGKGKPSSCTTSSILGTWLGQCLVSQPPSPLPLDMVNDDHLKKLASTCHIVPNSWPSWSWEPLKQSQRLRLARKGGLLHVSPRDQGMGWARPDREDPKADRWDTHHSAAQASLGEAGRSTETCSQDHHPSPWQTLLQASWRDTPSPSQCVVLSLWLGLPRDPWPGPLGDSHIRPPRRCFCSARSHPRQ